MIIQEKKYFSSEVIKSGREVACNLSTECRIFVNLCLPVFDVAGEQITLLFVGLLLVAVAVIRSFLITEFLFNLQVMIF